MIRAAIYSVVFLVVAVVSVVLNIPMGFAADELSQRIGGVSYSNASGTIWRGNIHDLAIGVQPLGDLGLETDLPSIAFGRIKTRTDLSGDSIRAGGILTLTPQRTAIVEELVVSGNTEDLVGFISEVRALSGDFQIRLDELVLSEDSCLSGRGSAWTNILSQMETAYQWRGPELDGTISCQNSEVVLEMAGANDEGDEVKVDLRAGMNFTGRLQADVDTANRDLGFALVGLGFEPADTGYVYRREILE